jgi:hypothetical protein
VAFFARTAKARAFSSNFLGLDPGADAARREVRSRKKEGEFRFCPNGICFQRAYRGHP